MPPHDPRQTEQPAQGRAQQGPAGQGGPPPQGEFGGTTQQVPEVSASRPTTPTLRWVSIEHRQDQVPIGPEDHVLNSVYNAQADAWDVLVVVQPGETEEADAEEEGEEDE